MHDNILLSVYARTYIEPAHKNALTQNLYGLIQRMPRYSFTEIILYFILFKVLIVFFSLIMDLGYEVIYEERLEYPFITLMTLKFIGIFYGFIFLPTVFIYSLISVSFCFYQKYSKNEDFEQFKGVSILPLLIPLTVFNFHNILSYYLWKRKFKNTKCYIKNYTFYLKATTNHSMVENSEVILRHPVTQGVLKGKLFLSEGIFA